MGSITVETISWTHSGNMWPWHKHVWVDIYDHPRGGDARFVFMLDYDECDGLEMCLNCLARRAVK